MWEFCTFIFILQSGVVYVLSREIFVYITMSVNRRFFWVRRDVVHIMITALVLSTLNFSSSFWYISFLVFFIADTFQRTTGPLLRAYIFRATAKRVAGYYKVYTIIITVMTRRVNCMLMVHEQKILKLKKYREFSKNLDFCGMKCKILVLFSENVCRRNVSVTRF